MNETQTVLGGVTGYRAWVIEDSGRLWPVYATGHGTLRPGGGPYEARCMVREHHLGVNAHPVPMPVPYVDCRCGFYAIYKAPGLTTLFDHITGDFWTGDGSFVIAVVTLSGTVIQGDSGVMRGQRMQINAFLDLPGLVVHPGRDALAKASEIYKTPLVKTDDFIEMSQTCRSSGARASDRLAIRQVLTIRAAHTARRMDLLI